MIRLGPKTSVHEKHVSVKSSATGCDVTKCATNNITRVQQALALYQTHVLSFRNTPIRSILSVLSPNHDQLCTVSQVCDLVIPQRVSKLVYWNHVPVCLLFATLQESSRHVCLLELKNMTCCHLQETMLCTTCWCRCCRLQQLVFQVAGLV